MKIVIVLGIWAVSWYMQRRVNLPRRLGDVK